MPITFNMIADAIPHSLVVETAVEQARPFAFVTRSQKTEKGFDGALALDPQESLFIGNEEECAVYLDRVDSGYALCIRAEKPKAGVPEDQAAHVYVLVTDQNPEAVFNRAAELALSLGEWKRAMQAILLEGGSYQELLDSSVTILRSPIVLSGVGLRIVAYTKELLPSERIIRDAIETGSFGKEAVEHFRAIGTSETWDSIREVTLQASPTEHRDYPILFYTFHIRGDYCLHLTLHLDRRPYTEGLVDQLQMLIEAIDYCLRRNPLEETLFNQSLSRVFVAYATGDSTQRYRLQKEASKEQIEFSGRRRILLLDYGYDAAERQLVLRSAMSLLEIAPRSLIALDDSCIIAMVSDESYRLLLSSMPGYMDRFPCTVVVSDAFEDVESIPELYKEVHATLQLEKRFPCGTPSGPATFTDHFLDYFLFHERQDQGLIAYLTRKSIPAQLRKEDEGSGANDYSVLYSYLTHERRISETSKALFIHRNTLIYRIQRIERKFDISLDDQAIRIRLVIEYRLMNDVINSAK